MNTESSVIDESRRITIFDTTLRDGEQAPGGSMNLKQKLEVARALRDLGVDVIEAGFPISSPGDFESVAAIAQEIQDGPIIAGLARCTEADIQRAADALATAARRRIHVFLATSAIHRDFKLKMSKEEIIRRGSEGVKAAKNFTDDVEFSPEDAARTELEFLRDVVTAAIEAGATTVNIPDTVGYATPRTFGDAIRYLKENVPGIENVVISVHCHNDLGLAVANSLEGISNGAGQIECTINGIGERAGNAALEEIVMALKTREDVYQCTTGIRHDRLAPTSRLVSRTTGIQVQRNKAIVGRNAFAHEAGIHQDGILKYRETYEIMRPEDVGMSPSEMVLGKHSGRNAIGDCLKKFGFTVNPAEVTEIYERFTALCDKKKTVFEDDVIAIAEAVLGTTANIEREWEIIEVTAVSSNLATPNAIIRLRNIPKNIILESATTGDGSINAVFDGLNKIVGMDIHVDDFAVTGVTPGGDAQGEVFIEASYNGRSYKGIGVATDTVQAAGRAYLSILNAIAADYRKEEHREPIDGRA